MKLWSGKSAAQAVDLFLVLKNANIDGPEIKKIQNSGSADFEVHADVDGDEAMMHHALSLAAKVPSSYPVLIYEGPTIKGHRIYDELTIKGLPARFERLEGGVGSRVWSSSRTEEQARTLAAKVE